MDDNDLPKPGSQELRALVSDREDRLVYEYLYSRRRDPPRMVDVQEYVRQRLGPRAQTERRLRNLRRVFELPAVRTGLNAHDFVYPLLGLRSAPLQKRRKVSKRVEAQVFEEYGYRCAMCGRSPKEDGVRLVLDHKIPLDMGGTNDGSNLQPLCTDHNHGKQAHFASFSPHRAAIIRVLKLDEPQMRVGELLKSFGREPVPVELIALVAREENRGDPTRRLRELRELGWTIRYTKKKSGKRTSTFYSLVESKPWPPDGARAELARLKRAKREDQT